MTGTFLRPPILWQGFQFERTQTNAGYNYWTSTCYFPSRMGYSRHCVDLRTSTNEISAIGWYLDDNQYIVVKTWNHSNTSHNMTIYGMALYMSDKLMF